MKNMKLLRLLAIVMTIGVAVGFTGCDDDDDGVVYNDDYILLGMNQAVKSLAGGECYTNLTLNDQDRKDSIFNLNMSLYQNRIADKAATVDLVIAEDSLMKAIDLAQDEANGNKYAKYKDAHLMPASYYQLSESQMVLDVGQVVSSSISLTVHKGMLLDDPLRNKDEEVVYVLPLQIRNSSSYEINSAVNTWMLMFTVPVLEEGE